MRKGLLIIYAGPSGVGKGTIRAKLFEIKELNLAYSISMTTRKIRPGEVDGVDYFFVNKEEFEEAVKNDKLLEHAVFADNCYGTPSDYVEKLRNEGKNVILEIECDGSLQVMAKCKDAISIFLLPPNDQVLEQRIRHRGTETEEAIAKRLARAKEEIKLSENFKYKVVNDNIDTCVEKVKEIILGEMGKGSF